MMNSNKDITGPINLGNDEEKTITDIANIIIKLTNSKSKIIHKDLPLDDPVRRKPNLDKSRNILKWNYSTDLEIGLLKTINYFRDILS